MVLGKRGFGRGRILGRILGRGIRPRFPAPRRGRRRGPLRRSREGSRGGFRRRARAACGSRFRRRRRVGLRRGISERGSKRARRCALRRRPPPPDASAAADDNTLVVYTASTPRGSGSTRRGGGGGDRARTCAAAAAAVAAADERFGSRPHRPANESDDIASTTRGSTATVGGSAVGSLAGRRLARRLARDTPPIASQSSDRGTCSSSGRTVCVFGGPRICSSRRGRGGGRGGEAASASRREAADPSADAAPSFLFSSSSPSSSSSSPSPRRRRGAPAIFFSTLARTPSLSSTVAEKVMCRPDACLYGPAAVDGRRIPRSMSSAISRRAARPRYALCSAVAAALVSSVSSTSTADADAAAFASSSSSAALRDDTGRFFSALRAGMAPRTDPRTRPSKNRRTPRIEPTTTTTTTAASRVGAPPRLRERARPPSPPIAWRRPEAPSPPSPWRDSPPLFVGVPPRPRETWRR